MIRFTIPGAPVENSTAQQKGLLIQHGKPLFYTKASVKQEKGRLFIYCAQNRPPHPLEGPLEVEIMFIFPFTQAQAKEHIEHLDNPDFLIFKTTRPDVDNSAKLLVDVLTKALFWHDDAQVTDLILRKRAGCEPKITVTVRPARPL